MSGDLHTRIADALCDCYEKYGVDDYNLMADEVIRELGLTRVTRSERIPKHRYVTEWETGQ